jgi:hypothetical protein
MNRINLVGVWRQCYNGSEWTSEEFFGILEMWGDKRFTLEQLKSAPQGTALYIAWYRFEKE